ncbi:hypothetical protein CEUSTIGMA_g10609.t1 [Chlamydomonas eustigma]|uniref:Uncharacterized protein n=1 Tax=Chlamydomonas eustigma TaxID=1157962 RepID=A0A250XJH6_9CHLO|nr:hypothetical protein CEUSTIGMA_g10609.t1 [Chlamydomonas eustigma]|eukprot:GAX83183.1 hypothetical protein CEUSTIGMA_g10609.t1 [Chlamydomonas eustigma]
MGRLASENDSMGPEASSMEFLARHYSSRQVEVLLHSNANILEADIAGWSNFFVSGMGLSHDEFFKLLRYSSSIIFGKSPYSVGVCIMSLQSIGLNRDEILDRIIPYYPGILLLTEEEIVSARDRLASKDLMAGEEQAVRLIQLCPAYLLLTQELDPILRRIRSNCHNK